MISELRESLFAAALSGAMLTQPLAGPIGAATFDFQLGGSGYDAANWSSRRGYVYFPTLNTQTEVTQGTRLEMTRRSRYLKRNVGFAKRCTRGLAQMVGYLSPRAFTDDKPWNKLAMDAFERGCGVGQGLAFDRSGRFNIYALQPALTDARLTDGDVGIVLTESQTGRAMVSVYESHQIGNGNTDAGQDGWRDGVRIVNDRANAFRLLDLAEPEKVVDVPAANFILHADYLSFGHGRGVTALHHAITNMIDTTEIRSDVKLGIKLGNRIGYYIEREIAAAAGAPKGMGVRTTTQKTEGGGVAAVEETFRGGKILGLDPGEKIKQLLDERPHPNSREFLEDLNRDISWGIGISPDVLWNIAKLGGASVRYVLADAQVWIEAQQQLLVDQFLHRWWVYFISKEIKAGRLRECEDTEWYWKVGWQPPAKLTVDVGRDGKLSIDLHRAGMLTLQRWYGAQGLDHEEELRQHVREYALRIKLCDEVGKEFGLDLDPERVFPAPPGAAPNGRIITPDDPDFGTAENIQRMLVEIRDDIAELRLAA